MEQATWKRALHRPTVTGPSGWRNAVDTSDRPSDVNPPTYVKKFGHIIM